MSALKRVVNKQFLSMNMQPSLLSGSTMVNRRSLENASILMWTSRTEQVGQVGTGVDKFLLFTVGGMFSSV